MASQPFLLKINGIHIECWRSSRLHLQLVAISLGWQGSTDHKIFEFQNMLMEEVQQLNIEVLIHPVEATGLSGGKIRGIHFCLLVYSAQTLS